MAVYKGTISGIGNAETRKNEITPDELAIFRNFVFGYKDGVLQYSNHDFYFSADKSNVHITDGMCFAYGYAGYCGAKDFTILPPAVEQYFVIYAKIDKSVIPNGCDTFIKSNYASPNIGVNFFRQDILSTVKTGVYEIPLWIFKATNKGVDVNSFIDLRPVRESIQKVVYSDTAQIVRAGGYINKGVYTATQPITDTSQKVASTEFVHKAIMEEINK